MSYCPVAVMGMGYSNLSTLSTSLTPGASSSALRAAATSTGFSKRATMLSEWARDVGMRTAVQLTGKSSAKPQIFLVSHVTFISSLVYPFSWNLSMCGMTLKGSGWAKILFSATSRSPARTALVPSTNSSMPGCPAPEAAWYVDMTIFFNPNNLCNGQTAISPIAVVQLGFAINFCPLVVSALISGTTNGIPSTKRNADELSITTAPSSPLQIFSACARLKSPSTAKKTTSHSRAASSPKSSTVTLPNFVSTSFPALRSDPKMRRLFTGKSRFSRHPTISLPTAPVAPTMPTFNGAADMRSIVEGDDDDLMGLVKVVVGMVREDVKEEMEVEGEKPYAVEAELAMARRAPAAEMSFMISIYCLILKWSKTGTELNM
mmetsp:Transcript_4328/g.9458  ORF Transcript_4328/g.9458 Transcript_4328/m.9458 type:complete len:376 (+) Transcript_4328:513-1640(+)